MSKKLIAGVSAVLTLLGLMVASAVPSGAQDPPPIAVEMLSPRSTFNDNVQMRVRYKLEWMDQREVLRLGDPSRTAVAKITVQPGAQFPWHTHAGPVIVNVAQGELVYVRADDCVERSYPMGTAFVDPGNNVHTAFNPSEDVTVLIATFFKTTESGPLTITEGVVAPEDCDVEVGEHSH